MLLISSIRAFDSGLKGSSIKSVTSFMFSFLFLVIFSYCSFFSSIFFSLFKSPSFLSSSLSNPLLKILPNVEYSNLACSTVLGLRLRSSPVKYSYLSKLLEDTADMLAASLSKSTVLHFVYFFCLKF